jgi:hypothetical protein
VPTGPIRAELDLLTRAVEKLTERQDETTRELEIQFKRIAELQADIDLIRAAWTKTRRTVS